MSDSTVYLASDVHLGAVPQSTEAAFRAWLGFAAERASQIIINGDLFDFWFEFRRGVPKGHERVLSTLSEIIEAGTPVTMLGGNHDWWGGSYLEDEIGVHFHRDPLVLDLAGRRTLLAHGDGLGKGDLGYRLLRIFLRGGLTRWAFAWLSPEMGARVARRVSRTEHRGGDPSKAEKARAVFLQDWAAAKLKEDAELDLVILGHTHMPTMVEVEPGRFYINGGDWVYNRTYLVLEEGRSPRLEEWDSEAGGRLP